MFCVSVVFVENAKATALENEMPTSLNSYTRNHNKAHNLLVIFKGMLSSSATMAVLCTAFSMAVVEIVFS